MATDEARQVAAIELGAQRTQKEIHSTSQRQTISTQFLFLLWQRMGNSGGQQ